MSVSSWYHVPKPEQRIRRETISVDRNGRRWSGSWTVEGDVLHVESAYGSRTASASPVKTRASRAEKLLGEIVDGRVRP